MIDKDSDDRDIEQLLNAAGERVEPPAEVRARVYAATLSAWQALPDRGQTTTVASTRHPIQSWLPVAATVCGIAVALTLWLGMRHSAASPVGQVVYATGSFTIDGATVVDRDLALGARLATGVDGVLTVQLASGVRVSLDRDTVSVFTAVDALRIERGRAYLDASNAQAPVQLRAANSTIVDIGTQYAVEVHGGDVAVLMREGAVRVDTGNDRISLAVTQGRGDVLKLANGEVVERASLATDDEYWAWRAAAREPLRLADASIHDYLVWMARDTGHELLFARDAVRQQAHLETIQSPGDRTSDDEDIAAVMETSGFRIIRSSPQTWLVDFRR